MRDADGTLMAKPLEKPTCRTRISGGGGIYSTAPDYLTLLQALLNGGSLNGVKSCKPETVALMSTTRPATSRPAFMKTTSPACPTTWTSSLASGCAGRSDT